MRKRFEKLLEASQEVWKAFLAYGPVDDGREEGERFDRTLAALRDAKIECEVAKRYEKPRRK